MKRTTVKKAVSGFVVRLEYFDQDSTHQVAIKRRKDVSRIFHSRDAAEVCLKLLQKENPNGDYFVSEKTKRDDLTLF